MTEPTIQIDETNGAGSGNETTNVSNLNYGSNDSANIVVATYPITQATNSFEKYNRIHVTNMGTMNVINNLRIWKSNGSYVTGEGIQTNLKTSAYSSTSYTAPSQTTYSAQAMPTSDPGTANLGIAGSLTGTLTAVGYSDYWRHQLQTTGSTPAGNVNQKTFTIEYDEQ